MPGRPVQIPLALLAQRLAHVVEEVAGEFTALIAQAADAGTMETDDAGLLLNRDDPHRHLEPELLGDQPHVLEVAEWPDIALGILGMPGALPPSEAGIGLVAESGETVKPLLGKAGAWPPQAVQPQLGKVPVPARHLGQIERPAGAALDHRFGKAR